MLTRMNRTVCLLQAVFGFTLYITVSLISTNLFAEILYFKNGKSLHNLKFHSADPDTITVKLPNGSLKTYKKTNVARLSWEDREAMKQQEEEATTKAEQEKAAKIATRKEAARVATEKEADKIAGFDYRPYLNLAFPGLGHFFADRPYKGSLYAGTALIAFAFLPSLQARARETKSDLKRIEAERTNVAAGIGVGGPIGTANLTRLREIEAQHENAEDKHKLATDHANIATGVIVLSYAISFIDAMYTFTSLERLSPQEQKKLKRQFSYDFFIGPNKNGEIGASFNFGTHF